MRIVLRTYEEKKLMRATLYSGFIGAAMGEEEDPTIEAPTIGINEVISAAV